MAKGESYYFSHDVDSFNDIKIGALCEKLGLEAYALFWIFLERMSAEESLSLPYGDLTVRAIKQQCGPTIDVQEFIDEAINVGLFERQDDLIFSPALIKRKTKVYEDAEERSKKARESANEGWKKRKKKNDENNAEAEQPQCDRNATAMRPQCERMRIDANEMKRNEIDITTTTARARDDAFTPKTESFGMEEVAEALTDLLGRLPSATEGRMLMGWLQDDGLDPGLVIACIEAAAINNVRNIGYVKTVLNSAVEYGCRTAEDFKKKDEAFQAKKQKQATARSGTLKPIPTSEDYLVGCDLDEMDLMMYTALAQEARAKGDHDQAQKYKKLLAETEERVRRANGSNKQHVRMD